jgi:PEP-CTERM motif-containing protein
MRNINQLFISLLPWTASGQGSGVRPRKWILGLSLAAALLSWGCPKQDPLQAFNPPAPPPIDQGPAPVPEPATALLFGAALLIGGAIVRRRRNGGHK